MNRIEPKVRSVRKRIDDDVGHAYVHAIALISVVRILLLVAEGISIWAAQAISVHVHGDEVVVVTPLLATGETEATLPAAFVRAVEVLLGSGRRA